MITQGVRSDFFVRILVEEEKEVSHFAETFIHTPKAGSGTRDANLPVFFKFFSCFLLKNVITKVILIPFFGC